MDNLSRTERLTCEQDEIQKLVDGLTRRKQLILYKYLNALGISLSGIDYEIGKTFKEEQT